MNKLIVVLSLLLILMASVVFYEIAQGAKGMKPTGKVTIDKHVFDVEVAKTDKDKQIGLTKYSSIKDSQGMFFVFDTPSIVTFWMKNMKFPIDMIFIKDDTIVSFAQKAPVADPKNPILYSPDAPANYVLEINSGLVEKYNIQKGDKVKIEIK